MIDDVMKMRFDKINQIVAIGRMIISKFKYGPTMTPDFWDPGILDPLNFNAELLNFNSRIYGILSRKCFFVFGPEFTLF